MEASNLTKEFNDLTHRVSFLEEENRWLKSQLFGRSDVTPFLSSVSV